MTQRQMLINYVSGEECRIAIVEDGQLEELYHERASAESHVGNIYKGRVTNVEPSIQAAFIDFGLERNGFLHISDLHPMYFPGNDKEDHEQVGKKTPRRDRPPIQKCLRRGTEILVQVLKEGIGTKGPTLTSYLSIPGRFLVMMPAMERLGVSRKVEDDEARREMRKVLDSLDPPEGFGYIIRTAGIGRTKAELKRDLSYLNRLWQTIDKRQKQTRVGELYTESDLVIRTIRDVFTTDITKIVVDDARAAKRASDFLGIVSPRSRSKVVCYRDPIPLFHRYDIERQIESISGSTVPLPSGGSLVIESTEALVAIDVNSGKMRDQRDADATAYKTNLEAADEICRQLRLRDLGGVVVNDLIDMRDIKKRRTIEARFKENLKNDRARTRVLPISQFGILEMTRQRMRPSLRKSIYTECAHCRGEGFVKSGESVVLDVMRRLAIALYRPTVVRVELTVSPDVAFQLLNRRRSQLVALETRYEKHVMVRVHEAGPVDFMQMTAYDSRGSAVDTESLKDLPEAILESPDEALRAEKVDLEQFANEEVDPILDQDPSDIEDGGEGDESENTDTDATAESEDGPPKKKRRRRRRGGRGRGRGRNNAEQTEGNDEAEDQAHSENEGETRDEGESEGDRPQQASSDAEAPGDASDETPSEENADGEEKPRRRRRRRGGRGRGGSKKAQAENSGEENTDTDAAAQEQSPPAGDEAQASADESASSDENKADSGDEEQPRRRRRRRGGRRHKKKTQTEGRDDSNAPAPGASNESNDDGGNRSAASEVPASRGYSNPKLTATKTNDTPPPPAPTPDPAPVDD